MLKQFSLQGKYALISGASSGLGLAMAKALAKAGAEVVLLARRESQLQEAVMALAADNHVAHYVTGDLAVAESYPQIVEAVKTKVPHIDIIVNAAGINCRQPVEEITPETWHLQLDLHLTAPFFLTRAFVPDMQKNGWGRVINIASLQSVRAFKNSLPYGAAKGGVMQMTRAMAEAWSKHGINVNAIAPGFFPTELTKAVFDNPEQAQKNAEQTMIGRNGRLDDIMGPAVFLASEAAAFVTGQTVFVDGGFSSK